MPTSFAAARTIGGVEHATLKDAQLLSDTLVNETSPALKEAIENHATPFQRNLLILLMASNFPVGVIFDTCHINIHDRRPIDDRWKRGKAGPGAERLELLRALRVRLAAISSKKLGDFGIGMPEGFGHKDTEL